MTGCFPITLQASRTGKCDSIRSRPGAGAPLVAKAKGAGEGASLPCLQCNNSTELPPEATSELPSDGALRPVVSKQHVKSAVALTWNVKALADTYGIERIGFLTLTFRDDVQDPKEAQRRFNSLATHVLRSRYASYIRVLERQKSGRIHYHLLVVLNTDIRTGFDFKAINKHDYRSAGQGLRDEWAFWRETARLFGFGRTELLPIRSTDVAIARYVGKYISKHVAARQDRDKGIRLVEYSRGARVASTRYQFMTAGAALWRLQLAAFARIVAEREGLSEVRYEDLAALLGASWAYNNREFIRQLPVDIPEGREQWFADRLGELAPQESLDGL